MANTERWTEPNQNGYSRTTASNWAGSSPVSRRVFILQIGIGFITTPVVTASAADETAFSNLLAQLAEDPSIVENAWLFQDRAVSRGVGQGRRSDRTISPRALDMITRLEISSSSVYTARYSRPIWPKGMSGVTIGIGYDLRFANKTLLTRDWGSLVNSHDLSLLDQVLGLQAEEAQKSLDSVQSVVISWDSAQKQFLDFIHYPTAQAEDIFPNSNKLSDDSFGALVSLVYNRGPAIPRNSDSRKEMFEIHELMAAGDESDFRAIPDKIRAMKRLWTTPDSRGLVIRRELEAQLFELGLT
jgi:GH24 family phage-related lysozyme (muramidase)